jgi:uncharacterized protein
MATRQPTIRVYRDASGGWRWTLIARNGRVVADSGEAYTTRRKAMTAAEHLTGLAASAAVTIED